MKSHRPVRSLWLLQNPLQLQRPWRSARALNGSPQLSSRLVGTLGLSLLLHEAKLTLERGKKADKVEEAVKGGKDVDRELVNELISELMPSDHTALAQKIANLDESNSKNSRDGKKSLSPEELKAKKIKAKKDREQRRAKKGQLLCPQVQNKDDLVWAVHCIMRLFKLGPLDVQSTLRIGIRNVVAPTSIGSMEHGKRIFKLAKGENAKAFASIQRASGLLWQDDSISGSDLQLLLRYANLSLAYRRAKIAGGKLNKAMRRNQLVEAQQLGQRINILAHAISPRTAFGYLVITMMGLNTATIEQVSSPAFKTLVQLFVCKEPPSFYGLAHEIGALLDYTRWFLVPTME